MAAQLCKGSALDFANGPDGNSQDRCNLCLSEQTGGSFSTAAPDPHARFPRQVTLSSPIPSGVYFPFPCLSHRGSAVGQTSAAPDLFARFDAGVYGDPSCTARGPSDCGLDQFTVEQILDDHLGCFG